jgi:hypothetical protein
MTDFSEMFDPSQCEGSTFDLLPIGIYSAQIIDAEVTVPQSNDGQGVKLVWSIITEGEHEKRQVWQHITFAHSNAQAQDIGRRQLKDLCEACGITTGISNPDPFKFIPCKIRVGVKKDKDGIYDDKNVVTRVWPASYQPPSPSGFRPPKPQAAWAQPSSAPGSRPQATKPAAPKSPPKSSPASSIDKMMEGVRFADYQPPDPPQTPTDEVKEMIIALHTKSRLVPQEISKELSKIDVKISTSTIENLLVEWNKYAGSRANGGTPPQTSSQASSQNSPQNSPPLIPGSACARRYVTWQYAAAVAQPIIKLRDETRQQRVIPSIVLLLIS